MKHYLNYIGGKWRDTESHLTIIKPANGQNFATIALASVEDAERAIIAAQECVSSGALTLIRPAFRTQWMLAAAANIRQIVDESSVILASENGKSLNDARDEFLEAARYFEYYAGMADKVEGSSIPLGENYLDFTELEPHGVSVHVIPWNFPVSICARSLAPALAAGNAVILKSPELSPIAMTYLVKAIIAAGFPKGAVQLLCGLGKTIGDYLVSHAKIHHIVFTGSVPTGQHILTKAAQHAIPCVMELGGKSAAVVLDDADIDKLISSVKAGIFFNAGQVCSALSRLLVPISRLNEIKQALTNLVSDLTLLPGNPDSDISPVISALQQTRVLNHIEKAIKQGAQILIGGNKITANGFYVAPTILIATPSMDIAKEEVFGPVLTLIPYMTLEEAIDIANSTVYGLVAGVFGESLNTTLKTARRLRAGQVFVNEWYAGGIETPFGGIGMSGYGREKGQEALINYVRTKNYAIKLS